MSPTQVILDRILADVTRQHGADKADISAIAACETRLISAYESGQRIRVRNARYGYERNGVVSRTTGHKPALMSKYRRTAHGSSDLLGPDDVVVRVID